MLAKAATHADKLEGIQDFSEADGHGLSSYKSQPAAPIKSETEMRLQRVLRAQTTLTLSSVLPATSLGAMARERFNLIVPARLLALGRARFAKRIACPATRGR
jgi:hypothetical protein